MAPHNALHRRYLTEVWVWLTSLTERKYLYSRKCNNITNNSKKRNSGK